MTQNLHKWTEKSFSKCYQNTFFLCYNVIKSNSQTLCATQKVVFIKSEGKIRDRISVQYLIAAKLLCYYLKLYTECSDSRLEHQYKKISILCLEEAYALKIYEGKKNKKNKNA